MFKPCLKTCERYRSRWNVSDVRIGYAQRSGEQPPSKSGCFNSGLIPIASFCMAISNPIFLQKFLENEFLIGLELKKLNFLLTNIK